MHHIYHTEGIVLGSRNYGEAGKCFYIFTRDLGMIHASAQGVRKLSSKLRFVLRDFSHIKVDLVQGQDFWRITTAAKTGRFENLAKNSATLKIFSNIARLLRRLLVGVEKNEALFLELLNGLSLMETANSSEDLKNIEANVVLTALDKLGYVENSQMTNRAQTIRLINQTLRETHL